MNRTTMPAHESIEEVALVQVQRGDFTIAQAERLVKDYRETFGDLPRSEAIRLRRMR